MNIKLIYRESNLNIDIMEETPCQYLYRVSQKVFRIKESDIVLFYGNIKIENDSRLIFDVMGKEDKEDILEEEIVTVKLKKDLLNDYEREVKQKISSLRNYTNNNSNSSKKLPKILKSAFSPYNKKKNKSLPVKCQICSHKNSIFYCRECNIFVCFECNIRYTEHHKHKRINLEDGDTKLGIQTYKEKILGELKLIDSGYKKFSKWIISNIDRDNFLQATFKLLEKVKRNSQRLSDINTLYNLDQDMINSLKTDIEQIKIPISQEELIDIFSSLNSKDEEIENDIKCVDVQIIKTEYNKVLVNCITNAQKHLKKIIEDVESKLKECEDMKFWGISEVKLYLKDNKKEKINLDIFNNEETGKIDNNENSYRDSSEKISDNEEEKLKLFRMNLNINSESILNSGGLTERKKNETNAENTKKRQSIIKLARSSDISKKNKKNKINEHEIKYNDKMKDDEFNHSNIINSKSRNNQNNIMKTSKSVKKDILFIDKNEDDSYFKIKGNDNNLFKSIMSGFNGDEKEINLFSSNKNNYNNEYPLILSNRNQNNNNKSEKYIQQAYKKYKNSVYYGKKLSYAFKQKNAKKD